MGAGEGKRRRLNSTYTLLTWHFDALGLFLILQLHTT